MQHITDYIEEHYDGNKSEFAATQEVFRSHVYYWCKGEYYIHDGKLFHLTRPLNNRWGDDNEVNENNN